MKPEMWFSGFFILKKNTTQTDSVKESLGVYDLLM